MSALTAGGSAQRWRRLVVALALAASASGQPVRAEPVALTFDDLPGVAATDSTAYLAETNRRLLRALRIGQIPATGFVVGRLLESKDPVRRTGLVAAWATAGEGIGNHTYSHEPLSGTPTQTYIGDVARNDRVLRNLIDARRHRLRWFRHPYLDTGSTPDEKHAVETWLAAHGYRVAPVTLENADWMFAKAYDDAVLKRDRPEAARIRKAYLDYTAAAVTWYRQAAFELLGRRPALIFLLHESRLNADCLGELHQLLSDQGMWVVTLDEAMRDPAYELSDEVADVAGAQWLTRWSKTLRKPLPWDVYPAPPAEFASTTP